MKKLYLISILVILSTSLHTRESHSKLSLVDHQLTDINLYHLQQQNNKTDPKRIQTHLDLISNQISLLQQTNKQFNSLSDIDSINNQGNLVKCKKISKQHQNTYQYYLQHVNNDLWALYFQIQQLSKEGVSTDQLAQQYQALKTRKSTLQTNKISYCPENVPSELQTISNQPNSIKDISSNSYISDLGVNNKWTYGKKSKQQYDTNLFQILLKNDVIKCPNGKPFATQGNCIACSQNQIFFLDTGKCGTCESGTTFNSTTHLCQSDSNNKCKNNQVYNSVLQKCQCPSGQYFDGTNCLNCFIPHYWNSKTMKCQQCQKGFYYSLSDQKCLQCTQQNNFISSLGNCHDQCTLAKPYYDGSNCISCPQIFNSDTKKCQSCPQNFVFNLQKGSCTEKPHPTFKILNCQKGYIFNSQNGICIKQEECKCPSNYVYNANKSKCQCPKYLPYDNGERCIECSGSDTWDSDLKRCVQPETFDPVAIAPIPVIKTITKNVSKPEIPTVLPPSPPVATPTLPLNMAPPITAPQKNVTKKLNTTNQQQSFQPELIPELPISKEINPNCSTGEIWNKNSKTCICRDSTPFRTFSGQCVSCQSPNQWSQILHKCLPAPKTCNSNYLYDAITQSCICPKDMPFNDGSKCQSCYLPMYWDNIDKSCKYCPQHQYFNPLIRKCQFCPDIKPLLSNHVCQTCPEGKRYNNQSYSCEVIDCIGGSTYSTERNDCVCSDSKTPFYNGRQCVSCLSPNRWDLKSKSCVYGTPDMSTRVGL